MHFHTTELSLMTCNSLKLHLEPDIRIRQISLNECVSVCPLHWLTPPVGAVRKATQEQRDVELLRSISDGEDNLHAISQWHHILWTNKIVIRQSKQYYSGDQLSIFFPFSLHWKRKEGLSGGKQFFKGSLRVHWMIKVA